MSDPNEQTRVTYRQPTVGDFVLVATDVKEMRVFVPALFALAVCTVLTNLIIAAITVGITTYAFALSERLQQKK